MDISKLDSSKLDSSKLSKYYKLAKYMAELFSKDPSTKVGAIILNPESHQILSTGYNGMPRKVDESIVQRWTRPAKYKFVEHAERNALYNAGRCGTSVAGAIAIVTHYPCHDCARGLIQSGIKTVVTTSPPDDPNWNESWGISKMLFEEVGVEVILLVMD